MFMIIGTYTPALYNQYGAQQAKSTTVIINNNNSSLASFAFVFLIPDTELFLLEVISTVAVPFVVTDESTEGPGTVGGATPTFP